MRPDIAAAPRRRARAAAILAAFALAAPFAATADPAFSRSTILAPKSLRKWTALDIDGDRLADLIVLDKRQALIFRQSARGFAAAPDEVVTLPDASCAIDAGFGRWLPGQPLQPLMLVVLCPDGIYALAQRNGRFDPLPQRLAQTDTLFDQPPDEPDLADFVLDLDGDGVEEVLAPARNRLDVFRVQARMRLRRTQSIDLDWSSGWSAHRRWCPVPKGGWPMSNVLSLAHRAGVSFTLEDWNRDGRLDLHTGRNDWQTRTATHRIWLQGPHCAFPTQPTATYRWHIDMTASERICDLDTDGRPELIVTSRLRHRWLPWMVIFPETQHTFVYRLGEHNAFQAQPACHFTSNLVGHPTRFVDWDRDGRLDALTFHSLIRATSKEQIAQALVNKTFGFSVGFHLAANGKLPTLPTFVKNFTYRLDRLTFPRVLVKIEPCADLNGDGRPDLLVETRPRHLEGYYQTPAGLSAKPDMELDVPAGCQPCITNDLNGDARADVVFVQPGSEDTRLTILLSKR